MPSHRADTPADAPTVRTATSAPRTPGQPPQQRRRDLRAHGRTTTTPRLHDVALATAPLSRREIHGPAVGRSSTAVLERDSGSLSTFGALALDPLFAPQQPASPPVALLPEPRAPRPTVLPAGLPPWPLDVAEPAPSTSRATPAAPRRARRRAVAVATPAEKAGDDRTGRNRISLPQAGIAGALGLATIAVPLTGAFAVAPPAKQVANTVSTAALAPLPPFPLVTAPARTALDDVRLLPDEEPRASVPARLAAPRTLLVGRASRSNERAVLPGCDGHVPATEGYQNGQLPASALCTLWDPRRQLRSDAAVAIAKLNLAYQQHFGHPMCFNDAYRSLSDQYRIKAERGSFAARPGTSEHGWGLAVDLCDGVDEGSSSLSYQWMRANAPVYGWQNPDWARPGGAGPYEPWHWEYFPGEKGQSSGD